MLRALYLSPLGRLISVVLNLLALLHRPFMVYGVKDHTSGMFRKRSRISSTVAINGRAGIAIADDVWIGHGCVVDGSGGVVLGEGVQLAAGVMVFSHGSYDAIRLHGRRFIEVPAAERLGYKRERVTIGAYSFIGAGAIVLPGTELGKGCLIAAGAVVSGRFDDFQLIKGAPAVTAGDVRDRDRRFFNDSAVQDSYFDRATIEEHRTRSSVTAIK